MEQITIRDIARLAGVGVTTVSRVINNSPDVRTQTRNRVLEVMREYGYTPNGNAKNLKLKNSDYVAIIIRGFQNPFLNSIVEKLQRHIEAAGYHFLVHYIDEYESEIEAAKKMVAEKKVCAVVFLGGNPAGHEDELEALEVPCVFSTSDLGKSRGKNLFSVCVDDRSGAAEAVAYLAECGHTKIAILGGELESDNAIGLRYRGAVEEMTKRGLYFNNHNYITSSFGLELAYAAVSAALERPDADFTALFAMSDMMAIAAIRAAAEHGLRVPQDISIIGFDGVEISRYLTPPLTTMAQPMEQIAFESIRLLLRGISGSPGERVLLKAELLEGKTVSTVKE